MIGSIVFFVYFEHWYKVSESIGYYFRVKKTSEQFWIPVPNLESSPFDFLPLSSMPPSVESVVTTMTAKTII